MNYKEMKTETLRYRTYLIVWAALVALTGLTVYVAYIDIEKFGMTINILIASIKAGLVVYIFMHLKYESMVLKLMLFMSVMTLTAIIVLTFADVLYR